MEYIDQNLRKLKGKPIILCWGGKDFCFNDHFYKEWQQRFPDAECHYLPDAGHYILEDAFEEVAPLIDTFFSS